MESSASAASLDSEDTSTRPETTQSAPLGPWSRPVTTSLVSWIRQPWTRTRLGVLFTSTTAVMLHPSPREFVSAMPANLGDPTLIAWLLTWAGRALRTDPLSYADAPNFWPNTGTLAYADSLLPLLVPFGPVFALTRNWALALNVTVVVLFVVNQAATFALVHWLTRRRDAALVAALAAGFSTFLMAHLGNPQMLALGFIPAGFLLLFRVLVAGRRRDAVWLGVLTAAAGVGVPYYGVTWAVCAVVVVGGWLLMRRGLSRRSLVGLGLAGVLAALLAAPVAAPYLALQDDPAFARQTAGGVIPGDLLTPVANSYLYSPLASRAGARGHEFSYFPGVCVTALAVVGVTALARRRPPPATTPAGEGRYAVDPAPADRQLAQVLLLAAVLACGILALGRDFWGEPAPFRVLADNVPGFSGIRAPSRLAAPIVLGTAMLAGIGWACVATRMRSTSARTWATAAVSGVLLLEMAAPTTWAPLPTGPDTLAVYRALATRPAGPAVELPLLDPAKDFAYPFVESPRQLYSSIDDHPRVNGYSGYFPPGYLEQIPVLNDFPAAPSLDRLQALGVRYVVLHGSDSEEGAYFPDALAARLSLVPSTAVITRYGPDALVDLRPGG